jgi:hypothetical protein
VYLLNTSPNLFEFIILSTFNMMMQHPNLNSIQHFEILE